MPRCHGHEACTGWLSRWERLSTASKGLVKLIRLLSEVQWLTSPVADTSTYVFSHSPSTSLMYPCSVRVIILSRCNCTLAPCMTTIQVQRTLRIPQRARPGRETSPALTTQVTSAGARDGHRRRSVATERSVGKMRVHISAAPSRQAQPPTTTIPPLASAMPIYRLDNLSPLCGAP